MCGNTYYRIRNIPLLAASSIIGVGEMGTPWSFRALLDSGPCSIYPYR
jgi:hypothetical protein